MAKVIPEYETKVVALSVVITHYSSLDPLCSSVLQQLLHRYADVCCIRKPHLKVTQRCRMFSDAQCDEIDPRDILYDVKNHLKWSRRSTPNSLTFRYYIRQASRNLLGEIPLMNYCTPHRCHSPPCLVSRQSMQLLHGSGPELHAARKSMYMCACICLLAKAERKRKYKNRDTATIQQCS
jgi:hypothetical protein